MCSRKLSGSPCAVAIRSAGTGVSVGVAANSIGGSHGVVHFRGDSHRGPLRQDPWAGFEDFDDLRDGFLHVGRHRVHPQLGTRGRLVRSVDAGEAPDLSRSCTCVETLRISTFALVNGRVDEHLDEWEVGLLVSLAQVLAIGRQRRDQRDHGDRSGVRHQPRHLADAANVLRAVARGES